MGGTGEGTMILVTLFTRVGEGVLGKAGGVGTVAGGGKSLGFRGDISSNMLASSHMLRAKVQGLMIPKLRLSTFLISASTNLQPLSDL